MNGLVLKGGTSPAIKTGLNQSNIIAVVASGSDLDLYVNHQHIAYVSKGIPHDKSGDYITGQLGVCAEDAGNPTRVMYNNAAVWRL